MPWRARDAFVCEHGNARVFVAAAGSGVREDACREEAVRVTRLWSEQFGAIGRRVNYLPDGAGMMGNALNQLFVGPNREGAYGFGIALHSDRPSVRPTELRFALRQDQAVQPLPLGDVPLESELLAVGNGSTKANVRYEALCQPAEAKRPLETPSTHQ